MKTLLLALSLLLLLAPSGAAQIRVNIYDNAGVPSDVVGQALSEAERILGSAGIQAAWWDCRPRDPEGKPCAEPGPGTLQLTLYPAGAESKFPVDEAAFGFALAEGRFVGIFHQRVENLARRDRIRTGVLLGHVIAHEIGHVLLGGGGHAKDGIMKFPWHFKELERLKSGTLGFLPRQKSIILKNLPKDRKDSARPAPASSASARP